MSSWGDQAKSNDSTKKFLKLTKEAPVAASEINRKYKTTCNRGGGEKGKR